MTLEELESQLKEMREQGAIDETEINLYSVSTDLDFIISDITFKQIIKAVPKVKQKHCSS